MNALEVAKLSRNERREIRDRYNANRELRRLETEPLSAREGGFYNQAPSILEVMACVAEDPAKLLKWLPARYDGHEWFADTLPLRRVLRDSVVFAIRRRGYTRVPPKIVDGVVNKVIDRARARGRKPVCSTCKTKKNTRCYCHTHYCYCGPCVMSYAKALVHFESAS